MLSEYWHKLGPSQFRRRLADLTVAVIPDKNLGHMRDIINIMDLATQAFFQEMKAALSIDEDSPYTCARRKDIMSILSTLKRLGH